MKLVEVVILVGSQCLSPLQPGHGVTEAGKVPCAVLIRQDPKTSDIEIVPHSAATDPDVIAMLVKPRTFEGPDEATGSTTAVAAMPRMTEVKVTPASDEDIQVAVPKPRPVVKAASSPRVRVSERRDRCGSYRAVWYTSKAGHRKYRCVKAG